MQAIMQATLEPKITPISDSEAAEKLNFTKKTIRNAVKRGVLTRVQMSGQVQHVALEQLMLFKDKKLSKDELSTNDLKKWQEINDIIMPISPSIRSMNTPKVENDTVPSDTLMKRLAQIQRREAEAAIEKAEAAIEKAEFIESLSEEQIEKMGPDFFASPSGKDNINFLDVMSRTLLSGGDRYLGPTLATIMFSILANHEQDENIKKRYIRVLKIIADTVQDMSGENKVFFTEESIEEVIKSFDSTDERAVMLVREILNLPGDLG